MEKREQRNKKWNEIISWSVRLLLLLSLVSSLLRKEYEVIFLIVLTLILTFYPTFLEKRFRVYLPSSFQIVTILFIFAAQYLGELKDFYDMFWWWDILLHLTAGMIMGIIGFMFVYLLNENYDTNVKLSPFFIVLFALFFAITIGVVWEIYEFSMDRIFQLNMQKFRLPGQDGLVDTMTDLIVDAIGAIIMSVIGYFYIKEKKDLFFTKLFANWFKKGKKE